MTKLSGWCIDELQARDEGRQIAADRSHGNCRRKECTCPQHERDSDD